MATREEQHSTRGRANVLRLTIAGRLGESGLGDRGVYETLDLCLECRACKAECPVGVDVARFKSEFLSDYWQRHGTPLEARVLGNVSSLADGAAGLRRCRTGSPEALRRDGLNQRLLGIDRRRRLPQFKRQTLRRLVPAEDGQPTPSVQRHVHESLRPGDRSRRDRRDAARWCPHGSRPEPLLRAPADLERVAGDAREMAERNTDALHAHAAAGRPIVFCEPSCLSAVREDAPALLRGESRRRAEQVAAVSVLFEEFAATLMGRLTLKAGPRSVLLHGHCHQKSMGLVGPSKAMLSHIPGVNVVDLDAGCCGMAGSFGYAHDHYDVSRAIGERKLFPAVRNKAGDRWSSRPAHRAGIRLPISRARGQFIRPSSWTACFADHIPPPDLRLTSTRGFDLYTSHFSDLMTLAWLSLGALVIAMIVSCFSTLNVGVLALALAWIVGVYLGSMSLNDVLSGFPTQLFLTLAGVTLLLHAGTIERHARSCGACRRPHLSRQHRPHPGDVFPARVGHRVARAGNVATAAMLAPMAMAVASRAAIPPFLMAIMVGNGAQSGALSPVAPTGIIVTGLMDKIGLGGYELRTYIANLLAHAIIAFGGYFLLGGLGLFRRRYVGGEKDGEATRLAMTHWITLGSGWRCPCHRTVHERQHRHGCLYRCRRAGCAARRRSRASDPQDAVDSDPDGQRGQRARGPSRQDRRTGSVHRHPGSICEHPGR